MKTLKNIDVVFENCDYAVIPIDQVAFLEMKDVNKSLSLTAIKDLVEVNIVGDLRLGIKQDALAIRTKHCNTLLLDQLHHLDIAQVCLNFETEMSDTYFVVWNEKNDFKNFNQINNYGEDGVTTIMIKKGVNPFDELYKELYK